MSNLPSVITIFARVGKLFARSYFIVLPFVLVMVICEGLVDKFLPIDMVKPVFNTTFLCNMGLQIFISMFFFVLVLYGCFLKQSHLTIDYGEILQKGLKRYLPVLGAIAITMAFFAIAGGVIALITIIGSSLFNNQMWLHMIGSILGVFLGVFIFSMSIYIYASTYLIVAKGAGPWRGIVQSYRLIKGHWFKTFFLILLLSVIIIPLTLGLQTFIGIYAKEVVQLLSYPLGASLMIVYSEILEQGRTLAIEA